MYEKKQKIFFNWEIILYRISWVGKMFYYDVGLMINNIIYTLYSNIVRKYVKLINYYQIVNIHLVTYSIGY